MQGFFTKKQTESKTRPDGKSYSCASCGLIKQAETPKLSPSGNFKKKILNICTIPTTIEDKRGKVFQNKASKLLKKVYEEVGIDLHEDCLNTYAVNCYSENKPTNYQIDCCRKYVLKLIDKHKPHVIVLFGNEALQSIIGHRWKKDLGTITKWQGWTIPDQELQAWVVPTFAPENILNAKYEVEQVIWKQDLQKVADLVNKSLKTHKEPEIITLEENDLGVLNSIKNGKIAFDYETTGLKPHAKGHKIICVSVAISENKVYTFMMPKNRKTRKPFTDLMQRQNVGKIAQNIKFEDTWTNVRLKVPVINWVFDTMQATHIIDNRRGVSGLKFQTYVQFGIIDYDSEVSPYLTAVDNKNANSINRIEELLEKPNGTELLLKYCALDSIYEYRLAMFQMKPMLGTQGLSEISPIQSDFPNAYKLMHEGILALAKAERQGLRIDTDYIEKQKRKLTNKIKHIEKTIFQSDFFKDWKKHSKTTPSLNSGDQLANYLYTVLKLKPPKETKGGKGSTDADTLRLLNIPELQFMTKRSTLLKLRDTFLAGIEREQVNNILHPFFNLHLVVTYRSSSSNINFQNLPKRDPMQMKTIRSSIFPSKGNQLFEMDFKGVEVAVGAAYHKDPNMIKYIENPNTDMHGDMASEIYKIKLDRSIKTHAILRGSAKNGFVFPQFYGDYYKNNAVSICRDWVNLPERKWKKSDGMLISENYTIGEHLISQGIKSYSAFEDHLKKIEDGFWNKRFKRYAKWKDTQWNLYQKKGYISFKTGFVCRGVLDFKNVGNYSIQGTAFHCLLWTFIEVTKELTKQNLKTKIVGQIHDAIVFDLYPPELDEVHALVIQIGTIDIRKQFDWINVPLSIDSELCPVDGSWAEKKDWKL